MFHPRTKDWLGISNPFIILSIVSAYLYFCKSLGPRLMENRKPFELKKTILVYNIFQVCFSIFLVYEGYVYIFDRRYSLKCETVDYSTSPRALRVAAGAWFYFAAKVTELLDTVFFVLRKKYNQVTFLHVYHHTLMSLIIWYGAKYYPGGHTAIMAFLNSIVHVIMYTYYLISSLGPEYQKYVWWKKHVTMIQLIQFSLILVHNLAPFFYECSYPKILNFMCLMNAIAFLYMFGNFYIKSYKVNKKSKAKLATKNGTPIAEKVNSYDARRKIAEKSR